MSHIEALVVGQLARDLVCQIEAVPVVGATTPVPQRREMLGGKGANQAVGLAQLGVPVGLLAVAGADQVGTDLVAQAAADGIDISTVVRRPDVPTGLIVSLVTPDGWRYLEELPEAVRLAEPDVTRFGDRLADARMVVLQMQQPAPAVLAAARLAYAGGAQVVLDGVPPVRGRDELIARASVLRADAQETAIIADDSVSSVSALRRLAARLLARGLALVALSIGPRSGAQQDAGTLVAWPGGHSYLPLTDAPVVDVTGAGDAYVAGLCAALLRGWVPQDAARYAAAAASATVGRLGGRPRLAPDVMDHHLALVDRLPV